MQVQRRALPPPDSMVAVGIGHVIKLLPQLDETIHQSLRDLKVGVGLSGAVNDQEVSLQVFGKVDRGGPAVS